MQNKEYGLLLIAELEATSLRLSELQNNTYISVVSEFGEVIVERNQRLELLESQVERQLR